MKSFPQPSRWWRVAGIGPGDCRAAACLCHVKTLPLRPRRVKPSLTLSAAVAKAADAASGSFILGTHLSGRAVGQVSGFPLSPRAGV